MLRQYLYAFRAVSPHDGVIDSLVLPWVSAETMSLFLAEVGRRHADEFIVMVMDQAGWHIAGDLAAIDSDLEALVTGGEGRARSESASLPAAGRSYGPRLRGW